MTDLTRKEVIQILAITHQARLAGVDLSGLDLSGLNLSLIHISEPTRPY